MNNKIINTNIYKSDHKLTYLACLTIYTTVTPPPFPFFAPSAVLMRFFFSFVI